MTLKNLLLRPLELRPVRRLLAPGLRDAMPIFMAHRFAQPDLGVEGHSPDALRRDLSFLRQEGCRLVSLRDLPPTANDHHDDAISIAFTVDDGYRDFLDVALPIFAEFDCPVTVFIATGVVGQNSWYWWDKITYAVMASPRTGIDVPNENSSKFFSFDTSAARAVAAEAFIEQMKALPEAERLTRLGQLGATFDVDVPTTPPAPYQAMNWSDVQTCVASGLVSFGPHTITHPVLPTTPDAQAEEEIIGSWAELQQHCTAPVPVFAYPTGASSPREIAILRNSGMWGAVTTEPRYSGRHPFDSANDTEGRFLVPRFAYPTDSRESLEFLQIVVGFEQLKISIRDRLGSARRS